MIGFPSAFSGPPPKLVRQVVRDGDVMSAMIGVPVAFLPALGPHDMFQFGGMFLLRDETVFHYRVAGVLWHEDFRPLNCPTWTEAAGCRCDIIEGE